ncbi:MAG: hypothetical protein AAFV07_13015, partial [Bacteroidota bacterium]
MHKIINHDGKLLKAFVYAEFKEVSALYPIPGLSRKELRRLFRRRTLSKIERARIPFRLIAAAQNLGFDLSKDPYHLWNTRVKE